MFAGCAGKLKDLGNTVLGKFGMSLDNFKAQKDPTTGSYSINFQQWCRMPAPPVAGPHLR